MGWADDKITKPGFAVFVSDLKLESTLFYSEENPRHISVVLKLKLFFFIPIEMSDNFR
ncbi:hypothetical protein D3C85_1919430 [compost metagenome]